MSQNLAEWAMSHSDKLKSDDSVEETPLVVVTVSREGDPSVLGRLGDLGLSGGEKISYFGRAPLGEPIYICVRETVIALRFAEASLIEVNQVTPSGGTT